MDISENNESKDVFPPEYIEKIEAFHFCCG
jgi:hypothetical protein